MWETRGAENNDENCLGLNRESGEIYLAVPSIVLGASISRSNKRSKSLTQIDRLSGGSPDGSEPGRGGSAVAASTPGQEVATKVMVKRAEPNSSASDENQGSQPDLSSGSRHSTPPTLSCPHETDRLSVPDVLGPCSVSSDSSSSKPRLYKLPRKIPSQEFFSVAFDILKEPGYEILPASKDVTLREAIQCLLDRRGIDFSAVDVFMDTSPTPLSLQVETYRLGGSNLHVRGRRIAKESLAPPRAKFSRANSADCGSASAFQHANRGSNAAKNAAAVEDIYRKDKKGSGKGRRGVDLNSEFLGAELPSFSQAQDSTWWTRSTKSGLGRKTGIFSNTNKSDKDKMEALTELLNQYSQTGIPAMPGLLTFYSPDEGTNDPLRLEDHWSRFVLNVETLSKRTQNQQDAIWELLETEVFYIRRLKIITDFLQLFIACLCNLQSECILNEIDTEKVFSNITDVCAVNQRFWSDHLHPMLEVSRNTGQPLNPVLLSQGFTMFDQIFHPYIKYCSDHGVCLQYVKEKHKNNDLFKTYVAWCETQKDCERLRLTDLLVKPMQRLTKYSLLLKAIHKKTDDEDQKTALTDMNQSVEKFVCEVDAILRRRHERERLSSIINRIDSYHVIETSNDDLQKVLKDYCNLDLTCPMPQCGNQQNRELLLERGALKLRDSSTSGKMDVHCFLFTDMLLICKALGKKGDRVRVIRQPFVVDRLLVQELKDGGGFSVVYLNEYKVATAAFILYTNDTKLWIDAIRKAQDQLQEARALAANSERQLFGYLRAVGEDDEYYFPSTALLVAKSPRSSSRSSLVHSRSGSVDISDPAAILPPPPASSHLPVSPISNRKFLAARTVSVELADFGSVSLANDDGRDDFGSGYDVSRSSCSSSAAAAATGRSKSSASPRPERRAFLLKGSGGSVTSPNTLSVAVPSRSTLPDQEQQQQRRETAPPSIQVPAALSPSGSVSPSRSPSLSPRMLQRSMSGCSNKCHPLMKMRQSSVVTSAVVHSAPTSQGPSPVQSFDRDALMLDYANSDRVLSDGDVTRLGTYNTKRQLKAGTVNYQQRVDVESVRREPGHLSSGALPISPSNSPSGSLARSIPISSTTATEKTNIKIDVSEARDHTVVGLPVDRVSYRKSSSSLKRHNPLLSDEVEKMLNNPLLKSSEV